MENKNELQQNKKIIIFIRHSERIDKAGEKPICGEFDPEITELGKKQSFITGQQIIDELEKILKIQITPNFINIRSSPYMRTIQTTAHMINGIKTKFKNNNDISNLNNVYIDYGLIERLKERKKYTKGYLNFLDNPNYANIDNELKNVVFIDKNENEFKIKTETVEECYERCKDYLFNVLKPIIINNENEKVKIYIIVCHQGVMKSFLSLLHYKPEHKYKIGFCEQFYFDISDGLENGKLIKIIKLPDDIKNSKSIK